MTKVSELWIQLFGSMEVRINGEPLRALRSRKGYWVLALLALRHGNEVERSWLAGTLWPDCTEAQSFSNLRRTLFDLRNAMNSAGEHIASPTAKALQLTCERESIDTARFDECLKRGDREALRQAVSIYRGPLLEGCVEDWVSLEREVCEQRFLEALERLASLESMAGNAQAATDYLRRAITVDPLRESAQRGLMQALAASGNYGAATLAYRDLRLKLKSEIGAEPSPETAEAYAAIKSSARSRLEKQSFSGPIPAINPIPEAYSSPAFTAPKVPNPITAIVGREQELRELTETLGSARFVTLQGPGGVGKTRLALELCDRLTQAFPEGLWFVDLSAVLQEVQVPKALARALGVGNTASRPIEECLAERLRGIRALIVMDNCEHLTAAAARLSTALLQSSPQLKIMATSRHAVGVHGETIWRVPSLSLPPADGQLPDSNIGAYLLSHSDAVRLFAERGASAFPSFSLSDENADAVCKICTRLDGIPLAIEFAAARLNVLSPAQIAERLDNRFKLLTSGTVTGVNRHTTLRATLDWSFSLLEEREKQMLCSLSVFAGGFTLDDILAVYNEGDDDEIQLVDLIAGLVDKSMVALDNAGGVARYRLLETTREYCIERSSDSFDQTKVRHNHAQWFLTAAETLRSDLHGPGSGQILARFDASRDNFCTALEWLLRTGSGPEDQHAALRLTAALCGYWSARGYFSELNEWVTRALRQSTSPTATRASVLMAASHSAIRQHNSAAAEPLIDEAESIFVKLNDRAGLARALNCRGRLRDILMDFASARDLHAQALTIGHEEGDKALIAASLLNLGLASYGLGEYPIARDFHQQCLQLTQEMGELGGVAWSLDNLADTVLAMGQVDGARELYRESLHAFTDHRNRHGIAACLIGLGRVETALGIERPGAAARCGSLFGAANSLFKDMEVLQRPVEKAEYDKDLCTVKQFLGEAGFEYAWLAGQAMSLVDAVELALDKCDSTSDQPSSNTQPARSVSVSTSRQEPVWREG